MPYLIQAWSGEAGEIKGPAAIFQEVAVQAAKHFWPAKSV